MDKEFERIRVVFEGKVQDRECIKPARTFVMKGGAFFCGSGILFLEWLRLRAR